MEENESDEASSRPYVWDERVPPTPEVLQLWLEVGQGLDNGRTVAFNKAVESLDHALQFFTTVPQAREFCESYLTIMIEVLVARQPSKIGIVERNCVQESLVLAVKIVAKDLEIQVKRQGTCKLLQTLSHAFNKKKAFYKGGKEAAAATSNAPIGLPEARMRTLEHFGAEGGFQLLRKYLQLLLEQQRTEKKQPFPSLTWLHHILSVLGDTVSTRASAGDDAFVSDAAEEEAILLAKVVMQYIRSCTREDLTKIPTHELKSIQRDLQRIFDLLIATRRSNAYDFYEFWRSLVLDMIMSQLHHLKVFGLEQVGDMIRACKFHRPPPRSFELTGAGCTFTNGTYEFIGEVTPDGYARPGQVFKYVRLIPETGPPEVAGKKLTLFRCTMRSQEKWWFVSEADEEQPGTDRDVDYYQHKARDWEEPYPPTSGWITCRTVGIEPAPVLESYGVVVPAGAELQTLEHQLAKWVVDNRIVEQVLVDTDPRVYRESFLRSTGFIKFLMCQLLAPILPLCPGSSAISLLKAVQKSLHEGEEKRDHLLEACSALVDGTLVDSMHSPPAALSGDVRAEALNLLWSLLSHPDASSLKSYEKLKQSFAHEIKVEPMGSERREQFLRSCISTVQKNQQVRTVALDELQALRMVKLLDSLLEACPRNQAEEIANRDRGSLPRLIFQELVAYMDRLKNTGHPKGTEEWNHSDALQERLRILSHVYGLSKEPLGAAALKELRERCVVPSDRERVMVLVSSAAKE